MGALQDLIPASFRGVSFYVPSGSVESGRHAVKHEYPDSNTRYVEDNGLRVPDLKIHALVSGVEAIARARRLENALSMVGPGTLMHPLKGALWVQVDTYHLHHKDAAVGIYEFDIVFHVTGPPMFPGLVSGIAAAITGLATSALFAMWQSFQAAFGSVLGVGSVVSGISGIAGISSGGVSGLLTSARYGSVSGLSTAVLSQATSAPLSGTTAATVLDAVAAVGGDMATAFGASQVVTLMARMLGRFHDVQPSSIALSLYALTRAPFEDQDAVSQSDLWAGFLALSDRAQAILADAVAITPTTTDLIVRRNALTVLGTTVQATAFCGLCEAAVGKTYRTADTVAEDVATLNTVYDLTAELNIGTEDRNRLSHLLAETVSVLHREQVTLPSVIGFEVPEMPASVLCYHLYESDTDLETIVGLNDGRTPVLYDGSINVLRA